MKDDNSLYVGVKQRENRFLRNVYLWMFLGLALTSLVSFATALSPTLLRFINTNPFALILILMVEMGTVIVLSSKIETMKPTTAILCFLLYASLTGFTFSSIIAAYAGTGVITKAFISATVVFAIAAIYGSFTKKDVSKWYSFLFIGLISLLVVTLVNFFLRSSGLDYLVSFFGIVIFTGLTIFDTKKIVSINNQFGESMTREEFQKISILGALDLYLDFLNIFLYLVRIFGRANSRNN